MPVLSLSALMFLNILFTFKSGPAHFFLALYLEWSSVTTNVLTGFQFQKSLRKYLILSIPYTSGFFSSKKFCPFVEGII